MPRTRSNRPQNRRLDALIALPLARFRTAVAALAPEELTALAHRIELKIVEQRWALGGHGLARHRAPQELALISRRLDETRIGQSASSSMRPAQLRLVEAPSPGVDRDHLYEHERQELVEAA